MVNLAVICEDDRIWSLPVWERALPPLGARGYRVAGIWTCPERLSRLRGFQVPLYYLRCFGILNFLKMGLFAAMAGLRRKLGALAGSRAADFAGLCASHGIPHFTCTGPNDRSFRRWMKAEEIDILVTMVGHIFRKRTLKIPKVGTVNKHAGLLPANKGLFPYFWARLEGQDQGISFHKVIRKVDSGEVLVQENVPPEEGQSMIQFYVSVQERFPPLLLKALDALVEGNRFEPSHGLPVSYHGLPGRDDYRAFMKRGGRIIRWRDVPAAWKL